MSLFPNEVNIGREVEAGYFAFLCVLSVLVNVLFLSVLRLLIVALPGHHFNYFFTLLLLSYTAD